MTDFLIARETSGEAGGRHGRYVIRQGGDAAELTWALRAPGLVSADHTGVPDSFRGTGAGLALVNRMIADARSEGFKIVPLCPFVFAQLQKHPEWADVFAPRPSRGGIGDHGDGTGSGNQDTA